MVFVNSYSDFCLPEADPWRLEAWEIMRRRPDLVFQICTKRPERLLECLPADWGDGWPHVWVGVTVETSEEIWRWRMLNITPAVTKFISYEPALGPLLPWGYEVKPNWIISGGESGPGSRPANPAWFRDLRNWCRSNNVPLFHKQNGGDTRQNGTWGGDSLDGEILKEFPRRTHRSD
jgi:protein gp37